MKEKAKERYEKVIQTIKCDFDERMITDYVNELEMQNEEILVLLFQAFRDDVFIHAANKIIEIITGKPTEEVIKE